jgi:hypothetical protein
VSFAQRFGGASNAHVHCYVIDRLVAQGEDGQVHFTGARADRRRSRAGAAGSGLSPAGYLWAVPVARIYEILPLRCTLGGA